VRGLYVHIPFCVKKCAYCDFYSLPNCLDYLDPYIRALLQEAHKYAGLSFETLYFGGGTPSLVTPDQLKSLLNGLRGEFDLSTLVETTIEANPESINREFLLAALQCDINRVSIGVQSLNNLELKSAGRIHNAAQAIKAIALAKSTGLKNISVDLMIGLPGQTWRSLKHSVERLLSLEIQHLSVYCLSLEVNTPLAENPPENLPSEDAQADLFERIRELLQADGFRHYEISNFAKTGYECLHNLNYWRGGEYLGLGAAAASHIEGIRFKNRANLEAYLKRPRGQTIEVEQLDIKHKAEEESIIRLRLLEEGLNIKELTNKYGILFTQEIKTHLEENVMSGALVRQGNVYRLHPSRVLTSNPIFASILSQD